MPTLSVDLSIFDSESTTLDTYSTDVASSGCGGSSDTSYARFAIPVALGAEGSVYYRFDLSALPAGSAITSVRLLYKANIQSTSYMQTRTISAVAGLTVKGTPQTLATSEANDKDYGTMTGWTEAEVRTAGICLYAKRRVNNSGSGNRLWIYGATLIVDYEPPAAVYYVKQSGVWRQLSNPTFYRKESGFWVKKSGSPFVAGMNYTYKEDR